MVGTQAGTRNEKRNKVKNGINQSQLVDALEDYGFYNVEGPVLEDDRGNEVTFTNTYSGRGMYGEKCFGITTNGIPGVLMVFAALSHIFDEDAVGRLASAAQQDSMGRDIIVYFPGFELYND